LLLGSSFKRSNTSLHHGWASMGKAPRDKTLLVCRAGHALQPWKAKAGSCDGCGKRIKDGQMVMDCRPCNWYLCGTCVSRAQVQSATLARNAAGSLPSGEMQIPLPIGDGPWNECLRDFKRTLEGGSLFVLCRGRSFGVQEPTQKRGDVSQAACERAFDDFASVVGFELQAQATGLRPETDAKRTCWHPSCARPAHHDGPCIDAFLQRLRPPEGCPDPLEPELLEKLVRHIVASISVNPGMQVVMRHSFSPALWQPTFVVCIGNDQVRVVTLAFIGSPVMGDRPSSKSTPFVLRLVTDDLLATGAQGHTQGPSHYSIQPAPMGVANIALHVTELADDLFVANTTGNRVSSNKVGREITAGPGISSSSAPQMPQSGCEQSNSVRLNTASPRGGHALMSQRLKKRQVSVLADGLSVKALTHALNQQSNGLNTVKFCAAALS